MPEKKIVVNVSDTGEIDAETFNMEGTECLEELDKLLKDLDGKQRDAYFECVIALFYPDGDYKTFEGKTYGEISIEEKGKTDFGYDSIFYSNDLNKTFGEATEEEKNSVSHRARAISKMLEYMENN